MTLSVSRIVPPPDHGAIFERAVSGMDARSLASASAMLTVGPTDARGHYLHWTDLRHREPPSGLTSERWWTGTRIARRQAAVDLPLRGFASMRFWFCPHNAMLSRLHWADRNAAGAMTGEPYLAEASARKRYLMRNLVEEAISSSQLEGASTTTAEARAMIASGRAPKNRDERMVLNSYRAMQYIRDVRDEPLSLDLVFELHRLVTEDTLERPSSTGRLRERSDGPVIVQDNRTRTVVHEPPPVEQLAGRMQEVLDFANGDSDGPAGFIHPLVRAIALHFMIGWIHPFVDSNGRTARALFYWSVSRADYWLVEYLSISAALKRAPIKYMHAYLMTETDGNDLTYFIDHQLGVLGESIARLHRLFERRIGETRATLALLDGESTLRSRLNLRQSLALKHALDHPDDTFTIATHMARHQITHQTARKDLSELSDELGLLVKTARGRQFVFAVPSDLNERIDGFR